jgi:hypothetical protein
MPKQKQKPAKIEEVVAELKAENQLVDDITFSEDIQLGQDTVYVGAYTRLPNGETTRTPVSKYMMYCQRLLVANGYVKIKGRGFGGPGQALIVSKVFRMEMHRVGIKTTWELDPKPTVERMPDGKQVVGLYVIVRKV